MKKLKHQYRQSIQSTRHDYFWEIYPNVRSSVFKKFSTHQERSFYFCIVLNIKTIRLDFVSHEVLAYPMFGMISQLMFMMLLKVGSIIQKERISIIANLIWNKLFRALRYHRSALIVVDG